MSLLIFESLYLHYYAIFVLAINNCLSNDDIVVHPNNVWGN